MTFLAERLFGKFNKNDVELIEDAFNPETPSFPLHCINVNHNEFYLHFYRAGLFIRHDPDYNLFVPFYDSPLMLFRHGSWLHNSYPRREDQIAVIPEVAEKYLDYALREYMKATVPVGQLLPRGDLSSPLVSPEEAEILASRVKNAV